MKYLIIAAIYLFTLPLIGQVETLSDEFDRTCHLDYWMDLEDTENWTNTHVQSYDINQDKDGMLSIVPWTTAWFASRRSNLLYKLIEGDFVFTTEVTALNVAETGQPSSGYDPILEQVYSLAGLMIRTPRATVSQPENYVFLSTGSASSTTVPQLEVKTTVNNSSSLHITNISTTSQVQIRLVRKANAIIALYRLPGGNWVVHRRYDRGDMPSAVQAGFVAYTDWNKVNTYSIGFHNQNTLNEDLNPDPSTDTSLVFRPDIIGKFEYARFEEVHVPEVYDTLDFSNASEVSNAVVLGLYGYDSETHDLTDWHIWDGATADWSTPDNWNLGSPEPQDSVLIPHCGCTEVTSPQLSSDATVSSLIVEEQGHLLIEPGVTDRKSVV